MRVKKNLFIEMMQLSKNPREPIICGNKMFKSLSINIFKIKENDFVLQFKDNFKKLIDKVSEANNLDSIYSKINDINPRYRKGKKIVKLPTIKEVFKNFVDEYYEQFYDKVNYSGTIMPIKTFNKMMTL